MKYVYIYIHMYLYIICIYIYIYHWGTHYWYIKPPSLGERSFPLSSLMETLADTRPARPGAGLRALPSTWQTKDPTFHLEKPVDFALNSGFKKWYPPWNISMTCHDITRGNNLEYKRYDCHQKSNTVEKALAHNSKSLEQIILGVNFQTPTATNMAGTLHASLSCCPFH